MRWVIRILVALVAIIVVAVGAVLLISSARLNQKYEIPKQRLSLTIPSDAASVSRGRHFAFALAKCVACHGKDLGGTVFVDAPPARIIAPNLTRGRGGIGSAFTDTDFVRAIRHGVSPDGRALLIMPTQYYTYLSDADLSDIIAYIRSVPPVDKQLPETVFKPLGRLLVALGKLRPPPAALIDHNAHRPAEMKPSVTANYGRYLAVTGGCFECHGAGLSGGPMRPGAPPAQNITPAGIGKWSEADFFRALRVGKRPDDSTINTLMPWELTSQMTDDEIKALLLYLRTVPPKQTGTN